MRNFIFIVFVLTTGTAVFVLINRSNRVEYKTLIFNKEYFGVVDTVFLDKEAKMQPKAILNTGEGIFIENAVYGKVEKGNTLIKLKGDFKHYLVKRGDTLIYYADYGGDELK